MPGMPQVFQGDKPVAPAPDVLAEVGQRLDGRPINVESQKAALRKGYATCAVCEMRPA